MSSMTVAMGADPLLRHRHPLAAYDHQTVEGALSPNAESDGSSFYGGLNETPSFQVTGIIRGDPLPLGIQRYSSSLHGGSTLLSPSDTAETASVLSHSQSAYAYSSFGGDHEPYSWDNSLRHHHHQRSISVNNQDSDLRGLTLEPRNMQYGEFPESSESPPPPFPWNLTDSGYNQANAEPVSDDFERGRNQIYKPTKTSSNEASPTRNAKSNVPRKFPTSHQHERGRKKRGPVPSKAVIRCRECHETFRNRSNLRRHRLKHARPFPCPFEFAGCASTFSSKNEWARHVQTIHERIYWYRCDQPKCEVGLFNRRDLFKCHYVRAHKVPHDQVEARLDGCKEKDKSARWPTQIQCGFSECEKEVGGPDEDESKPTVWRDWMEHRAEHYLNEKNWPIEPRAHHIDDSIIRWAIKRKHIAEKENGTYVFLSKRR